MGSHYNNKYYIWQKKAGEYGGQQNLWKFESYVKGVDKVLDFGCGGGQILEKLNCKQKYGIEINENAANEAQKRGITIYKNLSEIPKNIKFDLIFSHHVLEHLENPVYVLKELRNFLKKDGLTVHFVPIDDWRNQKNYKPNDMSQHLFTWTPQNLGNLFNRSEYKIIEIKVIPYLWLPLSRFYYKFIPKPIYFFLCKLWGSITRIREIKIVATI